MITYKGNQNLSNYLIVHQLKEIKSEMRVKFDKLNDSLEKERKLLRRLIKENPDDIYFKILRLIKTNKINPRDKNKIKKILDNYIKISDFAEKTDFWIRLGSQIINYLPLILKSTT